eukprot:2641002-Rhodomonas_salina.2
MCATTGDLYLQLHHLPLQLRPPRLLPLQTLLQPCPRRSSRRQRPIASPERGSRAHSQRALFLRRAVARCAASSFHNLELRSQIEDLIALAA